MYEYFVIESLMYLFDDLLLIVFSLVFFSCVAKGVCTSPVWNFSSTRLNDSCDVVSVSFFTRLSYFQNSSSYAPFFGCQQSIWSDPSSAHLNRSPFVLSSTRSVVTKMSSWSWHSFAHPLFRAHQQVDASRNVQLHETSFRLLILWKKASFPILFCRALRVWCDDARSRRSEWPTTRTRSRRVADREVDHVIEHRIVPLGTPQETNDEVYHQGPGCVRYLFALEQVSNCKRC